MHCLNKEEGCNLIPARCKTRTAFTTAGVLAYNKEVVKGVQLSAKMYSFSTINSEVDHTRFYSWNNYSRLLFGDLLIDSLKNPVSHDNLEIPSIIPWDAFIQKTVSHITRTNVSRLAQLIDEQSTFATKLQDLTKRNTSTFSWWKTAAHVASFTSIAVFIILSIWIACTRAKDRVNKYKKQMRSQPMATNRNLSQPLMPHSEVPMSSRTMNQNNLAPPIDQHHQHPNCQGTSTYQPNPFYQYKLHGRLTQMM